MPPFERLEARTMPCASASMIPDIFTEHSMTHLVIQERSEVGSEERIPHLFCDPYDLPSNFAGREGAALTSAAPANGKLIEIVALRKIFPAQ